LNLLERSKTLIDGSPLIALKAQARNGTRFSRLFFIERDPELADELTTTLTQVEPPGRWRIIRGDVNDRLPRLFQQLSRRSPTFVFLDTEGIEPKWTTLQAIAPWRVEFLINFPLGMSINRNERSPKTLEYFGTDDVLPLLESHDTGRTRALLDFYKQRLAGLGFPFATEDDRLVKTERNQRLYYLIFVSKLDIGRRIMDAVLRQPDHRGQTRFRI
jgi:three-Cys-motif partner protein